MKKITIVLSVILLLCSCEMANPKAEEGGILHAPSRFIGTWYCNANGGMIWTITKDNAVLTTTSSMLDISACGHVIKEDSSLGWKWMIYFSDDMYEEFRIMDGEFIWISSGGMSKRFQRM